MTDKVPDLWPDDLHATEVSQPSLILRAQASQLAVRTKGVLEGRVVSWTRKDRFYHNLVLVAPALGNYSYTLLTIGHDVKLYPVSLNPEEGRTWEHFEDEASFLDGLQKRLGSTESRRVIGALLTQSKNPDDFVPPDTDELPF